MSEIAMHGMDWNLSSSYIYGYEEANSLLQQIKSMNVLPLSNGKIFFSEDLWDFSQYTTLNISKSKMRFQFANTSPHFKELLKFYVLIKVLENDNKIQTIHRKHQCINNFLNYLDTNFFNSIDNITPKDIENYLLYISDKSEKTKSLFKLSIKDFFTFYSANLQKIDVSAIEDILSKVNKASLQAATEQNKYANIPGDYFNKLITVFLKTINDLNTSVSSKQIASCLLLLSQTGLRSSELLSLEINCMEKEVIEDKTVHYLKFMTWKREKGNNVQSENIAYMNELAVKAYTTLTLLNEEERMSKNTKFLFVPNQNQHLPVSTERFRKMMMTFYFNNALEIGCLDYQDPTQSLKKISIEKLLRTLSGRTNIYPNYSTISYPLTHQYRVYFCTDLYNKGVSLAYIQKFMSHLTSEMQGYYVRQTPENPQESSSYSTAFLEGIVKERTKLLGANSVSINKKIEQFIEDGNFNIETDYAAIAKGLSQKLPIREKSGGVCIKSSIRECSIDAQTDEFYCAYDLCPNIFHVFYMSKISYDRFNHLIETYTHNEVGGYKRQAEREKIKLKHVINKRLLPELKELQNEINRQGRDVILSKYPDLEEIIKNLYEIQEEAIRWRK